MATCPSCGEDNAPKAKFFLEAAADAFEAAGEDGELRAALDDLMDAYRRKGNLVALGRTEERIASLG